MRNIKKYLSVFAMLVRASFGRVILLLIVMAAGQLGLFASDLRNHLLIYAARPAEFPTFLETMLRFPVFIWPVAAAFSVLCVLLCLPGCGYSAKCGYTLRRLNISERSVFVLQTLCNAVMFFLFWAAEVVVCLAACRMYAAAVDPSLVSHHTVPIAFYRNDFLHSFLPMADTTVWIRNGIMLLVLAMTTALFPYKQRRGKFGADMVCYALLTGIFFRRSIGDGFNTFLTIFCGLILMAEVIHYVWIREEDEEEDNDKQNDCI